MVYRDDFPVGIHEANLYRGDWGVESCVPVGQGAKLIEGVFRDSELPIAVHVVAVIGTQGKAAHVRLRLFEGGVPAIMVIGSNDHVRHPGGIERSNRTLMPAPDRSRQKPLLLEDLQRPGMHLLDPWGSTSE